MAVKTKKKKSKTKTTASKRTADYYDRTILRPAARLIALIAKDESPRKSAVG